MTQILIACGVSTALMFFLFFVAPNLGRFTSRRERAVSENRVLTPAKTSRTRAAA